MLKRLGVLAAVLAVVSVAGCAHGPPLPPAPWEMPPPWEMGPPPAPWDHDHAHSHPHTHGE
jgi:hypothetical protein